MAKRAKFKQVKRDLIPASMEDLRSHKSVKLAVKWDHEALRWKVESSPATARKMLSSIDELEVLKAKHEKLVQDHKLLQERLGALDGQLALLQQNNRTLMQNIAADKRPEKFTKSPRNYFEAAEGRGLTVEVGGGLPGLGRRR